MELIDSSRLTEILKSKPTCIVQFSAEWCGPCKVLSKTVVSNKDEFSVPFFKIDIDKNRDLASAHNIRSVPTLLKFTDGAEVDRMIGNKSLDQLKQFAS